MKQQQRGFTLLATIFILVLLGMAGVYLLKIGLGLQQIVNYELLSSRAKLATISAFGLYSASLKCQDDSFHFGKDANALSGFEVKMSCQQNISYPSEQPTFIACQVHAKATYGHFGERDYVSYETSRWVVVKQPAT